MNKKVLIPIIIVGLLLVAGIAYLAVSLNKQKEENRAMQELAEMDKKEMENEYQQFARQYSEMKTQINNDSIVAQLTAEQERTQQLLEELRRTKSNDAREISAKSSSIFSFVIAALLICCKNNQKIISHYFHSTATLFPLYRGAPDGQRSRHASH